MKDELYRCTAVLGEGVSSYIFLSIINPVEVLVEGERVGWASVSREAGTLKANMVILKEHPARLDIENLHYYGHIQGFMELHDEPWDHQGRYFPMKRSTLEKANSIFIFGIDLRREPNYDEQPAVGRFML